MKREIKKIFTSVIMGSITIAAYSQTDSVKVEYSQEKITKQSKMDEAICDILTRREKNSKDLWKFDLIGTFLGGFNISYERKIKPKWSFNIQSITNFSVSDNKFETVPFRASIPGTSFQQNIVLQLRYYYNFNRRMRLGKKAGFSANYFGLTLNNQYSFSKLTLYTYSESLNGVLYYAYASPSWSSTMSFLYNTLNVVYGFQRKIGRIGYIDGSIGLGVGIVNVIGFWDKIYTAPPMISALPKLGIGIAF